MPEVLRYLHLEDDDTDAELVRSLLEADGLACQVVRARGREEFVAALAREAMHLILTDFSLPGFDGHTALLMARQKRPEIPCLFVSGVSGEETAIAALQAGAVDYVLKSNFKRLVPAVRRALREAEDARERRRLDTALRESERRLTAAQRLAHIGSWEWDVASGALALSDEACRILDLAPGASYRDFLGRIHPEDRGKVGKAVDEVLSGPDSRDLEFRVGEFRVVHAQLLAQRDPGGRAARVLATLQDITERRKLEGRYLQAQKMEAVGLLAGGIAHDFNNIVAAIVGNNYFLLDGIPAGDPLRQFCEDIQRSTDIAGSLTRQLVSLARKRDAQPRIIDPNTVVTNMAKMLRRLLGSLVKLDLRLYPSLAPVKMDSGHLEQVVMNLVVNARDAMPKGGEVTVATKNLEAKRERLLDGDLKLPAGHYSMLEVRDMGSGMDEATRKRIFEPFFTTKQPGRGTGLGLATVQTIVQGAGAFICVKSELEKGTTFTIYIPAVQGGVASLMPGSASDQVTGGQESILVIEDNDGLRGIIERALQQKGYRALAFRSAEDALDKRRGGLPQFDLLLTDVILPGVSGVELARNFRKARPDLPVVCMSGYPEAALSAGAGGPDIVLLDKPFSPDKLLGTLRRALDAA